MMITQIYIPIRAAADAGFHKARRGPSKNHDWVVFVSDIIELKTCHIYEVVLWTIKLVTHNLSGASNFIA
jgi:hypothetical protein